MDITTENVQLTLKFKTSSPDGLLFVYVSRTQTTATPDSISLSIIKGIYSRKRQLKTNLHIIKFKKYICLLNKMLLRISYYV